MFKNGDDIRQDQLIIQVLLLRLVASSCNVIGPFGTSLLT